MRIIDLPVIERFDRFVVACHNIGVARVWLLRALVLLLIAAIIVERSSSELWRTGLVALLCIVVTIYDEWRLKHLGARRYNALQTSSRLSVLVYFLRGSVGVYSFYLAAIGAIAGNVLGYITAAENIGWVLWWYVSTTYQPEAPPKHSWRELLSVRRATPARRAA